MMLYSHAKMLDQVIATFDRIAELDCNQTDKSMCALLSACLQNRRFDLVHQYFESVPAKTAIKPGVVAYNLLMRAYIDEKKIDSARSLLDKMESEKGIKPDVASYNVVLTAYLRNGEEEKFDKLFDELLNKGLEPNLVTYNLRIKWFCKKKDCDRAKEILQEMLAKGVKPNVNSYNAVIDGFCKIADFESAKKVFDAMNAGDESVKPNSDSYITLIQQLVQEKEFIQALDMCKESLQKKWVPPFTSMEGLVKGLVEISKADEAKEIVETMKKRLRGSAPESWSKVEGLLPLQHITA
ncbi:hypothetical protein IFM89_039716 [Coptis chinensis]|uniref:Pentatricopeptide repeat-containing protein n=1 Tax=Coptis chinensis TaxID=261450 RepID=A0A835GT30_9MAGN|nr:hypothetical protein IFM89_039716 [Coptis chinensis]